MRASARTRVTLKSEHIKMASIDLSDLTPEELEAFRESLSEPVTPIEVQTDHGPFVVVEAVPDVPLWIFRVQHARPTRDQLQMFFTQFSDIVNARASPERRVVLAFDLTPLPPSTSRRHMWATLNHFREFMSVYRERTEAVIHGVAVAIRGSVVKTLMSVLMRVVVPRRPVEFCDASAIEAVARKLATGAR